MHQKVNNLLALLDAFEVVGLVSEHFAKFGNASPPLVLQGAIDELEAALNESRVTPEELARRFHELYEELAPSHGYETRKESAVPWESVPEKNRGLMVAVCNRVLEELQ